MLSDQHEISGFVWVNWQGQARDIRALAPWQLENLLMYMEECAHAYRDRLQAEGIRVDWRNCLSGAYDIVFDELERRSAEAVVA